MVAGASAAVLLILILTTHPFRTGTSPDAAGDDTVVPASSGVPGLPDPCAAEAPPANAGPAALAYLNAVNIETPAEVAISDRISSSGFVTSTDLAEQIESDRNFIATVRAITFTSAVQPQITQLLDAITGYDNFLNLAASSASYYNSHQDEDNQLQEVRSSSAAAVRTALGLAPTGCRLNRP